MSQAAEAPGAQVTTLELFFDLVFVFTLTQLTAFLEHDMNWSGLGRVALLFGVLWWMYGGYAWLTNQVPPRSNAERALLLAGMAGFLVTAVAIPDAFGSTAVWFGFGYLTVIVVHLVMFRRAEQHGLARLAPLNLVSAGLVLGSAFVDGALGYAVFGVGLLIQVVTPYLGVAPQFRLHVPHFVERHGLLMIVALGESVVAIGLSVDTSELSAGLVAAVVLALGLPVLLWWSYFAGDEVRAEQQLAKVEEERRPVVAIQAYLYSHYPMLLGIVVAAAGIHAAAGNAADALPRAAAWALAGGVALFFGGDAAFRRSLRIGTPVFRLALAGAALATIPLSPLLPAWSHLALLLVLVTATLVVEASLA